MGSHGPHVKYFVKTGRGQPSFSVSISATPGVLASSLPQTEVSRAAPAVIEWVKLNGFSLFAILERKRDLFGAGDGRICGSVAEDSIVEFLMRVDRAHAAQKIENRLPEQEEEAPFEMANLFPRDTGLPMTIWVSPRGRARHDARVSLHDARRPHGPHEHRSHGDPAGAAAASRRPLAGGCRAVVREWIDANCEALVDYWTGGSAPVEFVLELRRSLPISAAEVWRLSYPAPSLRILSRCA